MRLSCTEHARTLQLRAVLVRTASWRLNLPAGRKAIRAYLRLIRLHRPAGLFLLLWPGWIALALSGSLSLKLYAVFAAGAFFMRAAGCAINDYWDRGLDARTARTRARPLASGELTPNQGLACAVFFALCACALLPLLPLQTVFAAPFLAAATTLYPLAKRRLAYPQAILAVTFGGGALMGHAAVPGGYGLAGWLLHAACACWIFGYDTVYAFQDMEDDARNGVRSGALTLGVAARSAVRAAYVGATLLFAAAGAALQAGIAYYAGVFCFGLLCAIAVIAEEKQKLHAGSAFAIHAFAGAPLWIGAVLSVLL